MTDLMIVAGEPSSDVHGARLVEALRRIWPRNDLAFFGVGGQAMDQAGVQLLFDVRRLASIGPLEAISYLPSYLRCFLALMDAAKRLRPKVAVLMDFPEFNIPLAGRLKRLGIKVIYYIGPQVWAWRRGRIKKIKRYVDKVLVILKFEEEFYRAHGVDAVYVGHPLAESVRVTSNPETFRARLGIEADAKLISLLPGSRPKEIKHIFPVMLQSAPLISSKIKSCFVVARAKGISRYLLQSYIDRFSSGSLDLRILDDGVYDALAASDMAVVKSGTSTLEAALLGVPTIIVYKISRLSWWIGKLLIDTPYYGLVNLVAGSEVAPELFQDKATPENIAGHVCAMLSDEAKLKRAQLELYNISARLRGNNASMKAAEIVASYLG